MAQRSVKKRLLALFVTCAVVSVSSTALAGPAAAKKAAAVGVKPIITGLIDRQGPPQTALLGSVHAYVVAVDWADLQPTPFGPIVADNAIDQAIARVREPDFAAAGVVLKLRVFAGVDAPDWVKNLDGPPIPYVDSDPNSTTDDSGTIGRFWTADYGNAYDDLETKLAALYDNVPEIREVTVSRCSTIYDEPFARQFGDPDNVNALLAAGYTTAADQQCIADSIAAHEVWQHTTSDVAFAPFPDIASPTGSGDYAFTESMMQLCRADLGSRCGLQNNTLASSKIANKKYTQLFAYMTSLGPAMALQTANLASIGTPSQVLNYALKMGADSIELPRGYTSWPTSLLTKTEAKLATAAT